MRRRPGRNVSWVLYVVALAACAHSGPVPAPAPAPAAEPQEDEPVTPAVAVPETVTVRDPELERRVALLELQLLAKDARIESLERQVAEARQEVVRSMAKLRSLATRAEAASGMAEAEIAVQALRSSTPPAGPELAEAEKLLKLSSAEFNAENYGGALYLSNQAKGMANAGQSRVVGSRQLPVRPGETAFAAPVTLHVRSRSNVREGPGTNFKVLYTLDPGAQVVGLSFANDWIRITDDDGRAGWIIRRLVAARP